MEPPLIIGIGFAVVSLASWIVASVLLHRHQRRIGDTVPLASADRDAVLRAQSLHNQATAGQMASMASARRQ